MLEISLSNVNEWRMFFLTFLYFSWIVSYALRVNVLYLRQPCTVVERYEISVDGHVLEASLHSTKSPDDVHNSKVLLKKSVFLIFTVIR